jgi:hypothetical protein
MVEKKSSVSAWIAMPVFLLFLFGTAGLTAVIDFKIEKGSNSENVLMIACFSISFLATYVAMNLLEGYKLKEITAGTGNRIKWIIFCIAALLAVIIPIIILIWFGANFLSFVTNTPSWALVIIALLIAILVKMKG